MSASIEKTDSPVASSEPVQTEKPGFLGGIKQSFKGVTRSGRREAQAKALAAEIERQRNVDPRPFPLRPIELADLLDPKSVEKLRDMGGVKGVLASLGTDEHRGLDLGGTKTIEAGGAATQDIESAPTTTGKSRDPNFVDASEEDRVRVYGNNVLPERKSNSLLLLMWLALQDKILILLCVAAVVSLALGIYTSTLPPEEVACVVNGIETTCESIHIDWVEGLAILIAIIIVDLVGSVNDYQKERQFKKLNAKKEQRDVKVLRQGKPALMSVYDVVVGDILQLEPGEIVPCDGIFLRGHNVKCDESGATGESDMIRKVTYDECITDLEEARRKNEKPKNRDCFLISGSKVLEGVGEYVVIAVGPTSFNGKLMLSLRSDAEDTPLQSKLNRLADLIAWLGSTAGIVLFTALMIRFFVHLAQEPNRSSNDKAQDFINILIIAVTVVVVAVPEGLPLAVTLALAFATKRMTKMNLLVRLLGACETMANASVVCTDKTGTLTQNEMSVVAGSIGINFKFADRLEANRKRVETEHDAGSSTQTRIVEQNDLNSNISAPLQRLFNDSIAINSTAFEEAKSEDDDEAAVANPVAKVKKFGLSGLFKSKKAAATEEKKKENGFVGSKTETALLKMAKDLNWEDYRASRERAEVVQMIPFSSERKAMGVVVKRPEGGFRIYLKGASEVLTRLCTRHVEVTETTSDSIQIEELNAAKLEKVNSTITGFANQTLRTLALVYRDLESFPPQDAKIDESGDVEYASLAQDLTLVAIAAIEDPLRPGVTEAVAACARAGVQVKMCTGDNVLTAKSIATQCGIYTPGGIVMEGPVFRKLSRTDMMEVVPRLQVLARSSPEDKKILVETLKSLGEVVGVTGDGTNDGPALKTANVGFSMGIAGTEVAKEASDIILMDDNFASIVSAIMWGRCVNDAVRKFLQFQLSVNISAVIVTFVTAVASEEGTSALKAVQLLWINLIMDTLAALALATDPATPDLLDRKPDRRTAALISTDMWKMIIGQSIYQTAVILVLNFAGKSILNMQTGTPFQQQRSDTELSAIVFNTFVWCQLFNQVNSRSLTRKLNIFSNLHKNPWFLGILAIEIGFQVLIMFIGGAAFSVIRLTGRDWGVSIVVGFVSWPLAVLIRLLPTQPFENFLIKYKLMQDPNALPPPVSETGSEDGKNVRARTFSEWLPAVGQVGEQLNSFRSIRGGRIAATPRIYESRERQLKSANFHHQSVLAMVPGFVVASIGGNWRSEGKEGKEDSSAKPSAQQQAPQAAYEPPVDMTTLYKEGKVTFHPETKNDDALMRRFQGSA
ncbi:Cation-transporting P-type ATPase, N-terminal [Kalmanozyma brasiliensis GHG001]|uniref:Calcium-transporting ATPase n=1 Tax=Kalmanozyma brasiliensis (strain GHG001) TaxID=1365824 RepID=V5GUA7_KALBG|nr:Cation-transporting P-type ATPase, N-terminal [Kalmanozyma brasiliensis GHG001]EST09492.1 Cation-transporting P-type ATPase, N-terminal [Kalmanozyma brasiliensis GHG001]